VCESFAFQKDAIEFAGWCNGVGPAVVAALQVGRTIGVVKKAQGATVLAGLLARYLGVERADVLA
jgi:hypothetical protein